MLSFHDIKILIAIFIRIINVKVEIIIIIIFNIVIIINIAILIFIRNSNHFKLLATTTFEGNNYFNILHVPFLKIL